MVEILEDQENAAQYGHVAVRVNQSSLFDGLEHDYWHGGDAERDGDGDQHDSELAVEIRCLLGMAGDLVAVVVGQVRRATGVDGSRFGDEATWACIFGPQDSQVVDLSLWGLFGYGWLWGSDASIAAE